MRALASIGAPIDLFQKLEPPVEVSVSETSLDDLFRKVKDPKKIKQLLPIIATLAIKPKIAVEDTSDLLETMK